ncbi:hypothetical protein N7510_009941 [Penicillium lagena]|uniref:uncharacterized protein n=1 Tax=Penicillium lagena TaxID=94218 RepID=UPI002541FE6C|nr:uncharacterized protein N7510_009941 [Penicillium lagena]KAJ5604787.1 hypothetical protein N7510_009941 [Penicillium lagena]
MNGFHEPLFTFQDHPVDQGRPIRVVIIGAGLSGIALYIRLLQYVPSASITIFEKNPCVGGTWYENRYPGVACDIPSHVYQYTFEPNKEWSKFFAPGAEILNYVQGVAKKYGVDQKVKYNTAVTRVEWSESQGVWTVTANHSENGSTSKIETKAEVLISAVGFLNNWKWPSVEGLLDFEGKLLHSANWDASWDYTGKKIALLGCGSSAIQILPHLEKKCPVVYNFIRSGTWISQPFGSRFTDDILSGSKEPGNYSYTPAEIERFKSDPEYYQKFRKDMESSINGDYPCLFPGTEEEKQGTQKIQNIMKTKLASKPGLYEALEPNFVPGCRRLTPGPGYLEALVNDNVQLIKSPITKVVRNGVVTADGKVWEVDGIACATGFDASHMPRFPVIGRNGVSLSTAWKDHASAYLSHSVRGFPNYFIVGGPNSATGGGSLLLILESVIGYIIKAVQKISREHIMAMEVKQSALDSWSTYLDNYFPRTVHVDRCSSWYKINGKIIGLYPGSSLHAMKTMEHPRWEDYEYSNIGSHDAMEWLGNGWTREDVKRGNLGQYLDRVDIPPIPTEETLARQP